MRAMKRRGPKMKWAVWTRRGVLGPGGADAAIERSSQARLRAHHAHRALDPALLEHEPEVRAYGVTGAVAGLSLEVVAVERHHVSPVAPRVGGRAERDAARLHGDAARGERRALEHHLGRGLRA